MDRAGANSRHGRRDILFAQSRLANDNAIGVRSIAFGVGLIAFGVGLIAFGVGLIAFGVGCNVAEHYGARFSIVSCAVSAACFNAGTEACARRAANGSSVSTKIAIDHC